MSRRRATSGQLPPFVPMLWEMLNSNAYKDLPPSAAKSLPYFLGKVKKSYKDPQRCLIEFHLSYREAKKYGFANTTHHRNICQLVEKGFIDPCDKGGLKSDGKGYNLFRLSKRWENYGTGSFKEKKWFTALPKV